MAHTRENPAPLKVIGLGLGRTGTASLRLALETLGFGPCHHTSSTMRHPDGLNGWVKAFKEGAPPEFLDELYRGYVSAVDSPSALLAEPLYKAFPDAKFILTVRDPAQWARSVQNTLLQTEAIADATRLKIASGTATETERQTFERMEARGGPAWIAVHHNEYHQGRLKTDPEGELKRHNEYIKQLIPHEQLLIFNVADGWKPLADFLGVPEPKEPFPRTNDTAQFTEMLKNTGLSKD